MLEDTCTCTCIHDMYMYMYVYIVLVYTMYINDRLFKADDTCTCTCIHVHACIHVRIKCTCILMTDSLKV